METTNEQREILAAIVQGFPGAHEALRSLRATFPDQEYGRMVGFLYLHGPRGPNLWERFHDRCKDDALILGQDLLAQVGEHGGWEL